MLLSNLSIKRPVFASVLMLALVTLGFFSYRRLAVDMFPEVEIPVLSVITIYPGASPEAVEREVTRHIEEAVNPIPGVKHVTSTSREGISTVVVEFQLEVRINEASQDARAKISAIRGDLPQGIEEPIIQKLDFGSMPVVSVAVRSDSIPPRELTTLVDKKIKRRLESLAGVGKVELVGPSFREVSVLVRPDRLEALGMGVDELVAGLQSENINTPLGRLRNGGSELPLRISGKPEVVEQFGQMVISRRGGRPITLGEVAEIRDGVEEQRSLALVEGHAAIGLDVLKQSGANVVEVVELVKREVSVMRDILPPGATVEIVRDGSIMIKDSVKDVQETLIIGALLTILIVFVFLNSWRSTVITGLTLPISVISAFIIMNFLNMTLNVMTLMALSLAIGLLIDDAIVVRENIVRHLEHGLDHLEAARIGTSEIGLAVLATTFSIVAVFVPVAFMKGIMGRFFFQFGLTVTFAVMVSLLVAFTLDPMLSSRWVDPAIARTGKRNLLFRALDGFNRWFDRIADGYRLIVGWALDHRKSVLLMAGLSFIGGLMLFGTMPNEFLPPYDQGEFQINFKTSPDASIEESRSRVEAVLAVLGQFPEVHHTYASVGAGDWSTVRDCVVYVKLVDRKARTRDQFELTRALRRRLLEVPGITFTFLEAGNLDNRKPLLVGVRGEDIPTLKRYALELKRQLAGVRGIVDLEASLEHDTPEYRMTVDRQRAVDAGLMSGQMARTLAVLVGWQANSTFSDEDGYAVDGRVGLPEQLRRDVRQLNGLRLLSAPPGQPPALVPLGDLVRFDLSNSPSEINRQDLIREVVVSGNLEDLPLGDAVQASQALLDRLGLPPGYRGVIYGEAEIMEESFGYILEALALAVIFVYLILAAQFESFIDPLSIMLSLPLSIVGMAGMLMATGDTLNIMSQIGLIMLMGLVTKNAILLVDYAKVLRGRGLDRRAALIEAGRTRLRPIMMTTLAMIFGMLPLALAIGAGAEMRAPMARAVIGGLITSTFLTLLVVPVMYSLLDDLTAWLGRRQTAPAAHAEAPSPGDLSADEVRS